MFRRLIGNLIYRKLRKTQNNFIVIQTRIRHVSGTFFRNTEPLTKRAENYISFFRYSAKNVDENRLLIEFLAKSKTEYLVGF